MDGSLQTGHLCRTIDHLCIDRSRDKWDAYEGAVNEMIQKTSTTYAPWHILESVDKKYARIKALRIVIAELEKVLDWLEK